MKTSNRKKALALLDEGVKPGQVAKRLGVSRQTVYSWRWEAGKGVAEPPSRKGRMCLRPLIRKLLAMQPPPKEPEAPAPPVLMCPGCEWAVRSANRVICPRLTCGLAKWAPKREEPRNG